MAMEKEDSVEIEDYDELEMYEERTPVIVKEEQKEKETPKETPAPKRNPSPQQVPTSNNDVKVVKVVEDEEEEEPEVWVEPVPQNLMDNLFQNLDVNRNGVIDIGDLDQLLAKFANLQDRAKGFPFANKDDITIEEIGEFLQTEFNEQELKLVLFHEKLKFVDTTYQQTNDGDIFALYRVFDSLNIDRGYLLVDDDKYLKADASGVSKERLHQILENLDRKSILKLLSLGHVEEESILFTWSTFFRIWKLGDFVFWVICAIVCVDGYRKSDGGDLPCDSNVAHFFAAYITLKAINYSFELCLTGCSCFFRHPRQFETRYIMSFLPFLSWLFSIIFRHACVLAAFVEVSTTSKDCNDQILDAETGLYTFFWWAMVYECVSFGLFTFAWASLPCFTLYLLSIAIRPRVNDGKPNQDDLQEPLTEFCKEQFHKHIRSGDGIYEFFLGLTGLSVIVKKNDLARLLVTSSKQQHLSKKDVMLWSTDDVYNWLKAIDMEKYAQKFVNDQITGNLLLTHVDPELLHRGFGIKKVDAEFIWAKLNELRKPTTVGSWSVNEVCDWLCRIQMSQYMEDFRKQQIDGTMLISYHERLAQVLNTIPVYHRHQLMAEMKILRNEGAPMTVGDNFGRHPLNYFGAPLAIQQSGNIGDLEERIGLQRSDADTPIDYNNLRDVEAMTPLVTEELKQEERI